MAYKTVLVVGCTLSGLSTALDLANRGFDVTLKESREYCQMKKDHALIHPLLNMNALMKNIIVQDKLSIMSEEDGRDVLSIWSKKRYP